MLKERDVFEARIYTETFRAYGRIHIAPGMDPTRLLNQPDKSLLPVTNPLVYATGHAHPPNVQDLKVTAGFLAVHRNQIQWLAGGRAAGSRAPEQVDSRRMAFMFTDHVLVGLIRIPGELRSSDFLESAEPFQTLYDVALHPWLATGKRVLLLDRSGDSLFEVGAVPGTSTDVVELKALERFEAITVNLARVSGILEASATHASTATFGNLN